MTEQGVLHTNACMSNEQRDAPISFRVRPSLKAKLLEYAEADRRSLSSYLEGVLEDHIVARNDEEEFERIQRDIQDELEKLEEEQDRLVSEVRGE